MKKIALLISFIVALALCAGAQTTTLINFQDMPMAKAPQVMPDRYPGAAPMYWENFFYVTPGLWSYEGPGFWVDPATVHNTVAFMGGPMCGVALSCAGAIKLTPLVVNPTVQTFRPVSITMSAGWFPTKVTINAYNNGVFIGTMTIKLSTKPYIFSLPAKWRVTELTFVPEFAPLNAISPQPGSVVIYNLLLQH